VDNIATRIQLRKDLEGLPGADGTYYVRPDRWLHDNINSRNLVSFSNSGRIGEWTLPSFSWIARMVATMRTTVRSRRLTPGCRPTLIADQERNVPKDGLLVIVFDDRQTINKRGGPRRGGSHQPSVFPRRYQSATFYQHESFFA